MRPLLCGLLLAWACQRGPRFCIFDGTSVGAAPMPFVAMNPDGTLDPHENRFAWREFTWPTDPQFTSVERTSRGWMVRGTTSGRNWSFEGAVADAGTLVRGKVTGEPPPVSVDLDGDRPRLLRYRTRPCYAFEGSANGVRTCTKWGVEINARTKLSCE